MTELTALRARWTVVPNGAGGLEVLDSACVLVEADRIVDVRRGGGEPNAARTIERPCGILVPGLVNLHNHALNGPSFRGIVDDLGPPADADALVHGLLMPVGDLAARLLSDEDIAAVYRLAFLEILRSGTTTVLDMPRAAHHPLFAVAREMGLRLVGAPYVFSTPSRGLDGNGRPAYEPIDEQRSLDDALRLVDRYDEGPDGRVRVGLGPHATDTCSPELLRRVGREARERGLVVTIHVAQSHIEVDTIRRRYGQSPVEYLDAAGLLGPNLVAAHCVYAEDSDLDRLRDTGTTVANCPLTFARSGVTVAFDRFHRHGVPTGIGTDAYSFDLLAEMRAAGFISKLAGCDAGVGDARTLLRATTEVGARALGRSDLGRIAPGYRADLAVFDLGGAHTQPVHDPLRNLVWNATPADVSLVLVDGQVVIDGGAVAGCDEASVVAGAARVVERLWEAADAAGLFEWGRR